MNKIIEWFKSLLAQKQPRATESTSSEMSSEVEATETPAPTVPPGLAPSEEIKEETPSIVEEDKSSEEEADLNTESKSIKEQTETGDPVNQKSLSEESDNQTSSTVEESPPLADK